MSEESNSRGSGSSSQLAPTDSLVSSLVSMDTEEHHELYDHRQQPEHLPVVAGAPSVSSNVEVCSKPPRSRANSRVSSNAPMGKTVSHVATKQQRRASFDTDNSQASRESQETEEDVCFPMHPQLHTRINGIDFDEMEEFARDSQQTNQYLMTQNRDLQNVLEGSEPVFNTGGSSSSTFTASSAALKYIPKTAIRPAINTGQFSTNQVPGISFGSNKVEEDESDDKKPELPQQWQPREELYEPQFVAPDRYSFFSSESEETVHATSIAGLVKPGQHFAQLFRNGEPTWWLDCSCPTDDEMRCITKAFGIHPLTAEDIRMQETREKVELFKSYYFVCFHTFESDHESEDFLEPINVYIVVFRSGVLTFHFGPISHCANVRRRVRQLRDYVNVNSDWLCYALIDDITDSFAPVIQSLEYEADAIEDSVFMARDLDFSRMLQRIGESRRKTMTLMRLLSGKADVIKMFAKRCQDEANGIGPALTSQINIANLQSGRDDFPNSNKPGQFPNTTQPRGDIALYLGDIQDHLLTMFQNLSAYEKIFSRSHSNYLAQLQVESFNSNNKVTEMLGKVTMIGTMLVPLNLITGLFGMNVKVPGQDANNLGWWFGILGVIILLGISAWLSASFWIKRIDPPKTLNDAAESGAKSVISSFMPNNARSNRNKRYESSGDRRSSTNLFSNRFGPSANRSVASLPSKYSRYD
ncbi:BN860_12552g1_1 [Zygosaccharomyces bailii CLIB 213]|uniref:BN860_12552g1_1 n=1 Tax=Zygosaccharomyces bailii (strain CLIB 213 / ATCC 58445 / CBS 680 / BCRC 21525 / NBRC 1098 / NCYC 1416 / NRRL Y-2227) TaxID=1333698 RepID=A0A8J2X672_ZYGB2|nr:BN860_12552g1_1 [Zygosaccharomyces bailii CLIB 213]